MIKLKIRIKQSFFFIFKKKYSIITLISSDSQKIHLRNCSSDFDRVLEYELGTYDCSKYYQFQKYLKSSIKKSKVLIDLGANIGLSSIKLNKLFEFEKIFSIEASKENFDILTKNVSESLFTPLNKFVSSESKKYYNITGKLLKEGSEFGSLIYDSNLEGNGVASITINEIIKEVEKDNLSIVLKIDIEGSENKLFQANTEFMDFVDIILIELHDIFIPNVGNSMPFFEILLKNKNKWDFILHGDTLMCFKNQE